MFPDARFVHIHRHPYQVFRSCRHYYDTATWYSYLQKPDTSLIDDRIIRRYTRLHDAFFAERDLIPEGRFHEIRFDDLERKPMATMQIALSKTGPQRIRCLRARTPTTRRFPRRLPQEPFRRAGTDPCGRESRASGDAVSKRGTIRSEMTSSSKRIAPGPPGHFLLGNLREFRRDVLGLVMESAATYGDVVRCRLGPQVVHLLNHPDHVEQVLQKRSANYDKHTRSSAAIRAVTGDSLLTCNGETWKRQRRMDQPAFHHRQIAGFAEQMTAATEAMLRSWQGRPELDISSEMARLTYSIVGQTLFSFDTGEDAATVEKAMRVILPHVFGRLGNLINWPDWFPTPANRRFHRSLAEVDEVVYRIIDQHRQAQADGIPDADLLSMLMRDPRRETGAGLDDSQLRNETITFLLAGHETTANALTWTFYLLSRHPEVEQRLLEELAEVLGGRTPTLGDVPKLTYTKTVIQESMRLYPPIWIIERRVIEEDVIGGYTLPAGSAVVISPYALHRHPAFWERPEEFDPVPLRLPRPGGLHSVRCGSAVLHRQRICNAGSAVDHCHGHAVVPPRVGSRAPGGTAAGHHAPLEARHEDDRASERSPKFGIEQKSDCPNLPTMKNARCTSDGISDSRPSFGRGESGPRRTPDVEAHDHRCHQQGRHRQRHQARPSGRRRSPGRTRRSAAGKRGSRSSSSAWGRNPSRATKCRQHPMN